MRVYAATASSLMDRPKYSQLALDENGEFSVPSFSEPMVLFAIVNEPGSGIYDKFVWLAKPH